MRKKFFKDISVIIMFIVAAIIFLMIVQILFKIPAPYDWLEAEWSAGDFVTFCGTIVLGAVACMQTQKANKMSQKLMQIEENRDRLEISPFAMVIKWKMFKLNKDDLYQDDGKIRVGIDNFRENHNEEMIAISLQFQNTTRSFITVQFRNGETSENEKWAHNGINQSNRKLLLKDGESEEIIFYASEKFIMNLKGKTCQLKFILENRFAERYEEKFNIIFTQIIQNQSNIYCDCFLQNYEIIKCNSEEKEETKKKRI